MSLKSLNWLKDGLLPLSIAIMIVCWLSPWMLWVSTWPGFLSGRPFLSPLSMVIILVASTFLTKFLLKQDWSLENIQATIAGVGVVVVLLFIRVEYYGSYFFLDPRWLGDLFWALSDLFKGLPPQLIGILLGAYLWWRGIALGRVELAFDDVLKAFRLGIGMLVALLILSVSAIGSQDFKAIQDAAVPSVLTFFFFSLLALSLSRLEEVREEARRREGKALGFNRDWLATTITSIVAIVFLGFVVSSIFSFDLAARLLGLLVRVADLLTYPLYVIFLLLGFVVEYTIYFVRFIMWLLHVTPNPQQPTPPEAVGDQDNLKDVVKSEFPPELIQAAEWLVLAAIIALVVFIFVKAIFRLRRFEREENVEEVHESLWSWQAFVDGVKAWLRSLWHRLFSRRKVAVKGVVIDRFRSDPQYQVSLSIRHIYQNLLAFAARLGFPKKLDQTPYEYLPVLEGAVPLGRDDLLTITEAYIKVRYGGEPAQQREFQIVDQAWSRLRTQLKTVEEERTKQDRS